MNIWLIVLVFVIGLFVGFFKGWVMAHHTIAVECERLGGLFVGKDVYTCVKIKEE